MHVSKASALMMMLALMLPATTLLFGVAQASIFPSNSYGTGSVQFSVSSNLSNALSGVVINEFMADNGITIAGPDGNSPDWIELYNAGTEAVDLSGFYLTDDLSDPTCWQFPEDTIIKAGEYLLVWADSNGGEGYALFGLNANGEEIGLFASDGVTLIDSVVYTKQLQDVSYGRNPDDNSVWDYLPTATPGSANRDSVSGETSVWSLLAIAGVFAAISIVVIVVGKLNAKRK